MPDSATRRSISSTLGALDFLPVFEAFDEGILITDTEGRILFYNETQAGIDGLRPGNVIGKKVADIYRLDWRESMICQCMAARAPIIGRLFFYRTYKGRLANTIHSVFPLYVEGALAGAICFVKNYNLLEKVMTGFSTPASHDPPELANGTRFQFSDLVGANKNFLHALSMARQAAGSDSPVMLCGETGSGKEMFAQSIHNYSRRQAKPFVAVNCAAIPDTLLEGVLFGTAKGAFTGALDKTGLFEQADGGTLLLDEINSMPINLQAKMLRVLQEKKVRRVGAAAEVPFSVKIVSSVNIPAHKAIQDRQLRMDLFYRLAVVYIAIPPLREQPQSIATLTRHFIYKNNLALGKQVHGVSQPVMQFFRSYHWPGNVRELEHIIEGAMHSIGPDKTLRIAHLPAHLLLDPISDEGPPLPVLPEAPSGAERAESDQPPSPEPVPADSGGQGLRDQRQDHERHMIDEALTQSGGNVAAAARLLDVSRQLIHYKMRRYGLERTGYRKRAKS